MTIKNKFDLDQIVYLTTNRENDKFQVTAITITSNRGLLYQLSKNGETYNCYETEISENPDLGY